MLERLRAVLNRRLEKLLGDLNPPVATVVPQVDVDALRARGNELLATGDMAQAETWFRKALEIRSNDVDVLVCLGYVLKEQGRLVEARIALRKAISIAPSSARVHETHYLLGLISEQQDDLADAVIHYDEALQCRPDFSQACKDLCRVLYQQGNVAAVRATLERCVSACPDLLDYRLWLTDLCVAQIDYPGVVEQLTAALRLGEDAARNYMKLGAALCRTGDVVQGQQMFARGEALDPEHAYVSQFEVGYYYLTAGELELGLEYMERCIVLAPDFLPAHSSVLMTLSHARPRSTGDYQRAALRYAAAVRSQLTGQVHALGRPANAGVLSRVLRIGFVSGDLYKHPVAFFLLDVLRHFERQGVQLLAYSNNPLDDEVTDRLRPLFDEWHSVRHLSDEKATELIGSHHVDILVDLAGHTGENRLALFGRRLAPIQVSWLGYWASTGLSEVDYLFADAVSVPPDSTEWFAEQIYRLPHSRLCMAVPTPSRPIPVSEPPSLMKGYLTFGSFQQVGKMTPAVLSVWAQILDAVPNARLRLQCRPLTMDSIQDKLRADLSRAGIDLSRVDLLGAVDLDAYLEAHGEVDVLLDTFPYPGGTTTAFALWMGVPTLTLAGDTVIARQGAAMLGCVGLSDWVATSESHYVELAREKSGDLFALQALRGRLRRDAEESHLFDAKSFAKDLREAFFAISESATKKHQ